MSAVFSVGGFRMSGLRFKTLFLDSRPQSRSYLQNFTDLEPKSRQ